MLSSRTARALLRLLTICALALLLSSPVGASGKERGSAAVVLGDTELFLLTDSIGDVGPEARAHQANRLLEELKTQRDLSVQKVPTSHGITIYLGETPVVELTAHDAEAEGRASLNAFADQVKVELSRGLKREERRAKIANKVLSFSTLAFLALLSFFLLRGVKNLTRQLTRRLEDRDKAVGALRIDTVELMHAGAVREVYRAGLFTLSWAARAIIVYAYVIVSLSLFERTRPLAEGATGMLFAPLVDLLRNLANHLPLTVSIGLVFVVLFILIRFIRTYVRAIEEGSAESDWLSPDTARVTGHVISLALFLTALLFVSPLLTGNADGILPRIGTLGLSVLALSTSPLLVSGILGARLVYSRSLKRGDDIEYGKQRGVVERIELLELRLLAADGSSLRVPHLLSLIHATRVYSQNSHPLIRDSSNK